jgi:hypothetical protein
MYEPFVYLCVLRVSVVIVSLSLATGLCGCNRNVDPPGRWIELVDDGQPVFEVTGLSARELAAFENLDPTRQALVFEVFVGSEKSDLPPIVGKRSINGGKLRFTPEFPLEPGMRYSAVIHAARIPGSPAEVDDLTHDFDIPASPAQASTVVEHIYPTTDKLPENQLKFYIHFSAPMSRGQAYERIHLIRADGKEVEAAFLELGEELWDRSMKRFTLLCDPGRVKRELVPRQEDGPVLEDGESYTLVIDRDWTDAAGAPLLREFKKSFDVLPPDETPIDPAAWKVEPPPADSNDLLVVRFPEPLDHSLLERIVWVVDPDGQRVDGEVTVADGETVWQFKPTKRWRAGAYQLVADTALEDLAGNAIGRAFDADVFEKVQKKIESSTVSVPFTIGEAR